MAMNDSRGYSCMKDSVSLPLVSFFVSTSLSFFRLPAVWRASGVSFASSQEVKLNSAARLPNDERLWHRGML